MTYKSNELQQRTQKFSIDVLLMCKKLPNDNINQPIVNQLVRSSTSIGANYNEAINASSRKDFTNKIFICKKEAQETKYWLTLIKSVNKDININDIINEVQELIMILQKTVNTLRTKSQLKLDK